MPQPRQFILIERRGNSERPLFTANNLEEMSEYLNTKTGHSSIGFDSDELLLGGDDDGGLL